MFHLVLVIEKGQSMVSPVLLQWHSRLARRTYMSVSTKKCEGREFEPPLEQVSFTDCGERNDKKNLQPH